MDHYQRLAANCHQTIEAIAMLVDELAPPLAAASEVICTALLQERKVLCCGSGADAAMAELFTLCMLGHFQQERPALPAMNLAADGNALAMISGQDGAREIFARPLRALGQPGDILLCVASLRASPDLLRAIDAAHERNMAVVALSNPLDDGLLANLEPGDVRLAIAGEQQLLTLHALVIQNLCSLIDDHLFGNHMDVTAT